MKEYQKPEIEVIKVEIEENITVNTLSLPNDFGAI